jgi:hypothetical protein
MPPAGSVVGAVFWPVALFVAVEILARTSWQAGRRWVAVRFGGLLPVTLVAAVVSYRHLAGGPAAASVASRRRKILNTPQSTRSS